MRRIVVMLMMIALLTAGVGDWHSKGSRSAAGWAPPTRKPRKATSLSITRP